MRKKWKLTRKGQRIQVLSIQTSMEYSNGEDLITSAERKHGRDRNHKLWMPSFVFLFTTAILFVSQINNTFVRLQTVLKMMWNGLPPPHSLSGIFAIPPILLYRMVVNSACYFRFSQYLLSVFFFNDSLLLYVIRAPHLHYVTQKRTNTMCEQWTVSIVHKLIQYAWFIAVHPNKYLSNNKHLFNLGPYD